MNRFGQDPTVTVSHETPREIAPGLGDQIMVLEGIGELAQFEGDAIGNLLSIAFWGGLIAAGVGQFRSPQNTRLRNIGLGTTASAVVIKAVMP